MALSLSGDGTLSGVDIAASGLGKVLQVVRATDTSRRSTSSTSFSDVPGMSVSITPTSASSTIIVMFVGNVSVETNVSNSASGRLQITDSSNVAISGAENARMLSQANGASQMYFYSQQTVIGYHSPATTSAVTYKLRFRAENSGINIEGSFATSQLFAIEVAA